jgi:hypothetical protein
VASGLGLRRLGHKVPEPDQVVGGGGQIGPELVALDPDVTQLATPADHLMQVTKSAASQLVTWLEGHGLVERVPDPADRRAALVRATHAADAGFRAARHRYAEMEDEWEQAIGPEGLAQLAATLSELESLRPRRRRSRQGRQA